MNPIIKLLAEQAGMNIKTNISGVGLVFGTFEGYKTSHITVEELEKFAGLIVKAVFDRIADERFEVYEPVVKSAKEHFGVEP